MSEDASRLYLITPPLVDAAAFAVSFEAALAAADVACVLLRFDPQADAQAIAKKLLALAQPRGVACLVGDARLAAAIDADGVHISAPGEALDAALKALKPNHIVGVGGLVSRDDAMVAGESGADYLMFGGPDSPQTFGETRERIAWWAEIFNLPCVAYANLIAEVAGFVDLGADFIALETAVWDDPRGPGAAVADVNHLLARGRSRA
ncbi:MAG: thiamine phosphate synthase [Methylovirgula sp.]|uniref:thiamine phosphate synthase n=1 Tax=Methylovirgula sp. TaxID=1978224 RepID=UPI0030763D50